MDRLPFPRLEKVRATKVAYDMISRKTVFGRRDIMAFIFRSDKPTYHGLHFSHTVFGRRDIMASKIHVTACICGIIL